MPHTEQHRLTSCVWSLDRWTVQVIWRDYKGTHLFLLDMTVQLQIDKQWQKKHVNQCYIGLSQCPHHWALLEQDLVQICVAINEEGNFSMGSSSYNPCKEQLASSTVTREHVQFSTPVMLQQAWFQSQCHLPVGTCNVQQQDIYQLRHHSRSKQAPYLLNK